MVASLPDPQPYRGRFDDVVPHVTAGHTGTTAQLREVEIEVAAELPITLPVSHVDLLCGTQAPDSSRVLTRFPLAAL